MTAADRLRDAIYGIGCTNRRRPKRAIQDTVRDAANAPVVTRVAAGLSEDALLALMWDAWEGHQDNTAGKLAHILTERFCAQMEQASYHYENGAN